MSYLGGVELERIVDKGNGGGVLALDDLLPGAADDGQVHDVPLGRRGDPLIAKRLGPEVLIAGEDRVEPLVREPRDDPLARRAVVRAGAVEFVDQRVSFALGPEAAAEDDDEDEESDDTVEEEDTLLFVHGDPQLEAGVESPDGADGHAHVDRIQRDQLDLGRFCLVCV